MSSFHCVTVHIIQCHRCAAGKKAMHLDWQVGQSCSGSCGMWHPPPRAPSVTRDSKWVGFCVSVLLDTCSYTARCGVIIELESFNNLRSTDCAQNVKINLVLFISLFQRQWSDFYYYIIRLTDKELAAA